MYRGESVLAFYFVTRQLHSSIPAVTLDTAMASPDMELFGGLRVPGSDESSRGQSGPTALGGATQHCLDQPS